MTPQEKDLITTLLTRLKSAESQGTDPEAEALIRQALAEQPDAPYFLVQTVLIQDISLHNAQNRIGGLEKELAEAKQAPQKPAPSFLGGLFGRSDPAPAEPSSGSVPASGPWTHAAAPAPEQPHAPPPAGGYPQAGNPPAVAPGMFGGGTAGGGFLRSAAATAAGVAGGSLLFDGIRSLFGHSYAGGLMGNQGMTPGLGESVINNYYGTDPGAQGGGGLASSGFDPGTSADDGSQDANQGFDPGTGSDQGSDPGQGDDGGQDSDGGSDFDSGGDGGFDDGGDVSC